jgi:hypothetical protein
MLFDLDCGKREREENKGVKEIFINGEYFLQ